QSLIKLTVRITLGHTLMKSTPVVLLVCMKSIQRTSSLRKADAKVVLLDIPTKQIGKYFSEYFVNKYNSLNMTHQ
ncbi:MAG: hypothetical protein J6W18_04465, partial [Bacteroidaceae bacterium]|nr:hypothetical protein [Bacteroidaceae bacterium]